MFEPKQPILEFNAIRLSLASPESILDWSYGEITRPETINYRTQKPEKEGLFDERIFGPTKDWECYCGRYKRIRYKGIVCDKCGVEVTHSLVRRQRMGHITLESPTSHIWFLRSVPSKLGLVLDLSIQNIERIIYFINYIVTEVDEEARKEILEKIKNEFKSKQRAIWAEFTRSVDKTKKQEKSSATAEKILKQEMKKLNEIRDNKLQELEEDYKTTEKEVKELKLMSIISEDDYHRLSLRYGHIFSAEIGAEAIRKLLLKIDISVQISSLEKSLQTLSATDAKRNKLIRRLKLFKSLKKRGIKPEWMILTQIPVIPPDLRPMVALDGGRFATSDLNDLYRRVINRNNRLKRLKGLNAPEVISRNEKRMLQEAVDSLIDNSARRSKTVVAQAGKKRQLKSLADILKGKQGRFRQNLLGKRIDYSGRSVIVVGPNLKLNQCGIPKRMALELFRPFVISKIIKAGYVHNIRSANRFIDSEKPEIWDILEDITKESFVLLNRAPTLHRLGIQAFQPVLIEGKALQIHPLVCDAYNADFDGDQMAVHVPLTERAKNEAKNIMLSTLNLLKPATGNPITNPNKDISWGCYYLTLMLPDKENDKKVKVFAAPDEALYAQQVKKIGLQQKIKVRFENGIKETTVGRIIFNRSLPKELPFYNELMNTKKIGEAIQLCLELCGREKTVEILDVIKELGFKIITQSGNSWSTTDLPTLPEKEKLIEEGEKKVAEIEKQYEEGLLTKNERRNKIINTWTEIKEQITELVQKNLDHSGSVYSMIDSGARGSVGQLTQMAGMKGLVSNPSGNIIELPIKKGFKEGLDVLEYFIATHGTRKGTADTALRTANAGYLTRRLVDVAQDVVIYKEDCGENEGRILKMNDANDIGESLVKRSLGRFVVDAIKDEKGEVILKKGGLIDEKIAREIEKRNVKEIKVRSILKCKCRKGLCKKCYGFNLAYNKPVELGVAVGIIAAQSIGEPGTQLTMRTFHTGGVAGLDITQGLPRVEELFEARMPKTAAIMTDISGTVTVAEKVERITTTGNKRIVSSPTAGQKIVKIKCKGILEDDYDTKGIKKMNVKDGDKVGKGGVLFVTKDGSETLVKHKGTVKIEGKKLKVFWEGDTVKEFEIPSGYVLWVKDGDVVEAGDQLTEGDLNLQELYKLKGKEAVQEYILKSILMIYFSQGQKLNNKHIEIIVRQMFSRINIKDAGDTELLPGEIVERAEFEDENEKAIAKKKKEAIGEEMFMGISRISLSTRSFLSAASFQETAKVLINAAITGKVDPLEGLKENVIIGRLIPAGTGLKK
ncbi:MAG: DNA-directed RNA polymerase subunit beta' [Patescibacteria group bacterium]|nr:DNA-directed RNA polymerase subunit beta' [Patescibacteria group bacterium]